MQLSHLLLAATASLVGAVPLPSGPKGFTPITPDALFDVLNSKCVNICMGSISPDEPGPMLNKELCEMNQQLKKCYGMVCNFHDNPQAQSDLDRTAKTMDYLYCGTIDGTPVPGGPDPDAYPMPGKVPPPPGFQMPGGGGGGGMPGGGYMPGGMPGGGMPGGMRMPGGGGNCEMRMPGGGGGMPGGMPGGSPFVVHNENGWW
ncbi:hypothetical protein K491DRAFT_681304 [Lophiostoma macrostomum CBS 122681]|uniref:Extracellular membrane protein CFEM domain-containing protein n=1 Tax=Lophiostoma macrostomum CBS 122681 TaxID=1314788 RepID=A0A6A6SXS0_9PLEO|nr:hypothetical protein K491DRAFT_681304 [Lophiostoma macrostomum CBS 122681]